MLARLWLGALVSTLLLAPAVARLLQQTATEIEVATSNSSTGGNYNGQPFIDDPRGQPITEVRVRTGNLVDSIEVLYGNVSGGVHGRPADNSVDMPNDLLLAFLPSAPPAFGIDAAAGLLPRPTSATGTTTHVLSLKPGELIIGARGRSGDALDELFFFTNQNREVGGGGSGGKLWYAYPPDGSNGYLCKVSGLASERLVGLLTFHWCIQGNASLPELSPTPPATAPPP